MRRMANFSKKKKGFLQAHKSKSNSVRIESQEIVLHHLDPSCSLAGVAFDYCTVPFYHLMHCPLSSFDFIFLQ